MQTKKFSLQQYSGFAGVLLLMHNNSVAQAVYTDFDPDVVLSDDGNFTYIDMDGNGNNDFFILKKSHYFTNTLYSWYRFNRVIYAGPQYTLENEIAGIYATNGAGGGITYFPYALLEGDLINNDLSFQNGSYQLMGIGFYKVDVTPWTWNYYLGYWSVKTDSAYLGVRFLGADDCKHYGWIRCSVGDSLKTLTVHDFAYELKCNTPIAAGDTIGDTTTVNISEINNLDATIYTFNQNIYIHLNTPETATIQVFSITGTRVYNSTLTENNAVINLTQYPAGSYIVQIKTNNKQFSKIIAL